MQIEKPQTLELTWTEISTSHPAGLWLAVTPFGLFAKYNLKRDKDIAVYFTPMQPGSKFESEMYAAVGEGNSSKPYNEFVKKYGNIALTSSSVTKTMKYTHVNPSRQFEQTPPQEVLNKLYGFYH